MRSKKLDWNNRDDNGYIEPTACGTRRDDCGGGYHWAVYDRASLEADIGRNAHAAEYEQLHAVVPFRAYFSHNGGRFRSDPHFRVTRTRILVTQQFGVDI